MKSKKSDIHLCSECLDELSSKELFVAEVPDREYYTTYCIKCMIILGIEKCRPYTVNTFKSEYLYLEDLKNSNTIKKQKTKKITKK